MPFEVVETETKDNMPPTALISYMRARRKGGAEYDRNKVKPRLTITVPTSIFISKAERFLLLVGTGADAGKARIKATKDKKGVKPSEFKAHLILRFGHVPKLGDEIFDGERCAIRRVSDDEYEIDATVLKDLGK
jgi:hypothetical protein